MAFPSRLFQDTFRDMQRAMSQFDDVLYNNSRFFETPSVNFPPSDLIEHKDNYEVHCEIPGFNKEDIHIDLNDQTLNIRGTVETSKETRSEDDKPASSSTGTPSKAESSKKDVVKKDESQQQLVKNNVPRYWTSERQKKSFSRSFGFPTPVKSEGITANYKDGVLIVKVPKAENTSKRITIE